MMSDSSRRLVSSLLLLVAAGLATAASPARIEPAPGVIDGDPWRTHAEADAAWAAAWTGDWNTAASLATASTDSIATVAATVAASRAPGDDGPVLPPSDVLRDRWHARGHLACRIRTVDRDGATVLVVDPGPLYRVGAVDVETTGEAEAGPWLERWLPRPGDRFDGPTWDRAVRFLLSAAGEAGHPFAAWSVRGVALDAEAATVDVRAVLSTGRRMVWGPVSSSLGTGTAGAFAGRVAGLGTGRPFRDRDLVRARERLLARDLYAGVGEPVLWHAAPDTVGVHWPITPRRRANRMAVVLGLSRPDDGSGTRLSGQADLLLGNIAGTGRRLEVAWSDDGESRSRFGLQWREPLVAGTPLDADLGLDQEVVDGVHARVRLDLGVSLPVRGGWQLELGAGRDRGTFPAGEWTRSTRTRARVAVRRSRLDPAVSGWGASAVVEEARRRAEARAGDDDAEPATPREERQTIVDLGLEGEIWFGSTVSGAIRGRFADVGGDEPVLPLVEQFRLGGATSLRGYREDRFHGERMAVASLELRLGRPGRSRVYSFLDLGYVRQSRRDPVTEGIVVDTERPLGYGLGLITTGAGGDVSLAIGFPGTVGLDRAKLHVSLLQTF